MYKYNHEVSTIKENEKIISIRRLALPLLLQNLLAQVIGTVSTVVLSGYSETAVTATNIAGQISNLPTVILNTIATGTVILASIYFGRRKREKAAAICGCGVLLAFALSVIAGIFLIFAADKLTVMMNLKGETQQMSALYLRMISISLPIRILFNMFQQLLICNGYSKVIVISGTTSGALSAVLSYLALYRIDLPFDDMITLGIISAICSIEGLIIALFFFFKKKCPIRFWFNASAVFRVLKFGLPAGMCLISYVFSNTITAGFLAGFGESAVNAMIYINSIVVYVPIIGYAISSATATLMGRHRGAKRFDSMKILFRQNLIIVVGINLVLALIAFAFRKPLLSIFTDSVDILKMAVLVMLVDIPLEMARGVNNMAESSLNPNGDVRTTMIVSIISCWAFSVGLGYVLCVKFNLGLLGLWIGFFANEAFKAIAYLFRWHSNKWQKTKI